MTIPIPFIIFLMPVLAHAQESLNAGGMQSFEMVKPEPLNSGPNAGFNKYWGWDTLWSLKSHSFTKAK